MLLNILIFTSLLAVGRVYLSILSPILTMSSYLNPFTLTSPLIHATGIDNGLL